MIGSLRGRVLDRNGTEVLIEVNGVGYRVTVTPQVLGELRIDDPESFVYIHHHIREDAAQLFGFASLDERRVFETLIATHGVGPSLGLAILSTHAPSELRRVVQTEDVAALCLVPGVGKKTAARLLIELKNKLEIVAGDDNGDPTGVVAALNGATTTLNDAHDALAGLGFAPNEIAAALDGADPELGVDALIKSALHKLATR